MKIVGVHQEEYGVYVVVIKPVEVLNYEFFPLTAGVSESQSNLELALIFKELGKKYPSHSHWFVFGVPEQHITVHDLSFPFKEKFKINQALPYEIENIIPLSMDQITYGSKMTYQDLNKTHVLAYIASKKWIQDLLTQFQSTSIEPHILTPHSLALGNLFEDWTSLPLQTNKVVADEIKIFLSYKNSVALVMSQNRVIHSYDIPWNLQPIIEDIAAKYKKTISQALEYFYENAYITHTQAEETVPQASLVKIIKKHCEKLSNQMKILTLQLKSMDFLNSVKEIQIFGPGSSIQNLPAYLFNTLKIPIKKLEHLPQFPSIPLEYLSALGIAIEALKKPKNPPINLIKSLKSSSEEMIQISKEKKQIIKSIAMVFMILCSYMFVRNWQSRNLEDRISQTFSAMARKVANLKTREISIQNVEKFLKNRKQSKSQMNLFQQISRWPSSIKKLEKITNSISEPEKWMLEIQHLEIQESQVILSGFVLKDYFKNLKDNLTAISLNKKIQDQSKEKFQNQKQDVQPLEEKNLEEDVDESLDEEATLTNPATDENKKEDQGSSQDLEFFYFSFKMQGSNEF